MNNFSTEWDDTYKKGEHASVWPWSDLVSFVNRYSKPDKQPFKVLEIGCGAGANISFFKALGVEYFAVEGSNAAVNILHHKYPELKNNIKTADFTVSIPFDGPFDLIVDRASLTHNNTNAIKKSIELLTDKLKSGGVFIGIDWFSTSHTDYQEGEFAEDKFTKTNFINGQFVGLGRVHFANQTHLEELFLKYEILVMEHKTVVKTIPTVNHTFASWNFVVKKIEND
jgi:SAM-dependent methyltransferase